MLVCVYIPQSRNRGNVSAFSAGAYTVHNVVRDGRYNESRWAFTPHPQAGLIYPSWWNARKKVAIATLCVQCGTYMSSYKDYTGYAPLPCFLCVYQMRPKAREMTLLRGPPSWLEDSDPAGWDLCCDGQSEPPFLTDLTGCSDQQELQSCELLAKPAAVADV